MRVLLLTAFVASTYAASHRGAAVAYTGTQDWLAEWNTQQAAAVPPDANLVFPAGVTAAAAKTYDEAIQADKAKFFGATALGKTPPDFTAAKAAFAGSITACGVFDALIPTSWETTATPAKIKALNEAVIEKLLLDDHDFKANVGVCNDNATPAAPIANLANKGSKACTAAATTNKWVAGDAAAQTAYAKTTAAAAHTASWGKTCAEQWAFGASVDAWGPNTKAAVWQGRDLTAAEVYGFGPPTTTAKPSAKSPAAALAAGVAAIALLL